MNTNERIYKNIKFVCKSKRIKFGELEKEAGISRGYFVRLCKQGDKKGIGINKLVKICEILNVKLDDLVYGNKWRMMAIEETKEQIEKLQQKLKQLNEEME